MRINYLWGDVFACMDFFPATKSQILKLYGWTVSLPIRTVRLLIKNYLLTKFHTFQAESAMFSALLNSNVAILPSCSRNHNHYLWR